MVETGTSDNPHHPTHVVKVRDDRFELGVHVYLVTNFRFNAPYVWLTSSTHLHKTSIPMIRSREALAVGSC